LILTSGCAVYRTWKCGSRRVWSVNRGCLLLHGTWSHLWYIQRSVYAHSLICISYKTYEIDYWSLVFVISSKTLLGAFTTLVLTVTSDKRQLFVKLNLCDFTVRTKSGNHVTQKISHGLWYDIIYSISNSLCFPFPRRNSEKETTQLVGYTYV
jgi:hypothetical protein